MKSLSLLLPLLLLPSCKDSTSVLTPQNTESKNLITVDELMRAQGACAFIVQIPDDIQASDMVGLAFKHADGSIDDFGGSGPWEAGEKAKVFIFSVDEGNPKYSIVSKDGAMRGTLPSKYKRSAWSPNRSIYKVGEGLIRYSSDNVVGGVGSDLRDGEVDVILYVKKSNG